MPDKPGYTTLDCRDGQHRACAHCDCECHAPDIAKLRWAELERALGYVSNAEFELSRATKIVKLDHLDTAYTWLGDVRRSLGALALLLSDEPDAAGYAALLGHVLTAPRSTAEQAYIERQASDE